MKRLCGLFFVTYQDICSAFWAATLRSLSVFRAFHMSAQTQEDATLDMEKSFEACLKCGQQCCLKTKAVQKGGGLHCNLCKSVYQMMYRHLGGTPDSLPHMSSEEQKVFFREASQVVKTGPKNGRWSMVRTKLTASLVHFRTEQTRTRITHEYLPLSVWQTRGFDVELVRTNGESRECPVPCLY